MDLNQRTEEISDLVFKLTPISDMAILLGVTEIELRERDIELASAGSPTAAENVVYYFRQMLQDE